MPQTRELFIKRQIYQNYTRQNRAHAFLTNDGSFIATLAKKSQALECILSFEGEKLCWEKEGLFS